MKTARWQTARGIIRRFRPDRNPLRRTADRIEAAILAGLVLVLLAAGPLAGHAAAGMAAASGARTTHAQASWRQTSAVLLQDAPTQAYVMGQASSAPLALARWTAPDGTRHEGKVPAPAHALAGRTVPVWTNRSGTLEAVPVQRADVVLWEVLAAGAAVTGVIVASAIVFFLARILLDRRRLAAWDAAWPVAHRRWSGRP